MERNERKNEAAVVVTVALRAWVKSDSHFRFFIVRPSGRSGQESIYLISDPGSIVMGFDNKEGIRIILSTPSPKQARGTFTLAGLNNTAPSIKRWAVFNPSGESHSRA